MKNWFFSAIGITGSFVAYLLGGWNEAIITLLLFMLIDYVTGLIVAGVFHQSKKTESGTLESRAGWKGLIKKGMTLLIIVVANRLDIQLGTSFIKDGVCIAFISNEVISIIENAGLMGLPIPEALNNAIHILKEKEGEKIEG